MGEGRTGGLKRAMRWTGYGLAGLVALVVLLEVYEYGRGWRPREVDERIAAHGEELYRANCVPCHGAALQGMVPNAPFQAPPLQKFGFAFWFYAMPHDMEGFIAGLVGSGRRNMPPFGAQLKPADLESLAVYIHQKNTGAR